MKVGQQTEHGFVAAVYTNMEEGKYSISNAKIDARTISYKAYGVYVKGKSSITGSEVDVKSNSGDANGVYLRPGGSGSIKDSKVEVSSAGTVFGIVNYDRNVRCVLYRS